MNDKKTKKHNQFNNYLSSFKNLLNDEEIKKTFNEITDFLKKQTQVDTIPSLTIDYVKDFKKLKNSQLLIARIDVLLDDILSSSLLSIKDKIVIMEIKNCGSIRDLQLCDSTDHNLTSILKDNNGLFFIEE